MAHCNFDPSSCSINCKKYPICTYYAIQNQISDIQSQLNFIYNTIGEILKLNERAELKVDLVEKAFHKFFNNLPDSDMTLKYKESNNEEEN